MFTKLNTQNFKTLLSDIRRKESERAARHLILHPDGPLVKRHQSVQSCFCKAVVAAGYLTQQQMQHAAQRYHLGMSRDGGVIFWQIDQLGQVYDGKVMYYHPDCHRDHHHKPTWVSAELKRFYQPPFDIPTSHCLFGTHLLRKSPTPALPHREGATATESPKTTSVENSSLFTLHSSLSIVAVVEAEKTAVILSEHYPECLWLASGGLEALRPELLFPLHGHRIILFPDTDETCTAYARWYQVAHEAFRLLGHPVYVSPLLEQRATPAKSAARSTSSISSFLPHSLHADFIPFGASKHPVCSLHPASHTDLTDPTDKISGENVINFNSSTLQFFHS